MALLRKLSIQLFLGGRGTGAPLHLHTDALNVLAWGRKRWLLYPPSCAGSKVQSAASSLRAHFAAREGGQERGTATTTMKRVHACGVESHAEPFEVIQEAGDAVFVPASWGHLTVNLQESVGVAFELYAWAGNFGRPERW